MQYLCLYQIGEISLFVHFLLYAIMQTDTIHSMLHCTEHWGQCIGYHTINKNVFKAWIEQAGKGINYWVLGSWMFL